MPYARRASATFIAVIALTGLSGCGEEDPGFTIPEPVVTTTAPPVTPATPGATTTTETPATPGATPTDETTGTADCPSSAVLADGSWEGPLKVDLHGVGGTSQFTDSPATGTLRVTVEDGKATGGTWNLSWSSEGSAKTKDVEAFIKVAGNLRGTVSGSAAKPTLAGTWRLDGSAGLVLPEKTQSPIRDSGDERTTMTISSADCRKASGRLAISFDSKDTLATFSGKGTWAGKLR